MTKPHTPDQDPVRDRGRPPAARAPRRAAGVTHEPSGDTVVVLDPAGTVLVTLNPVGALIWSELDGRRDLDTLCDDLLPRFDGVDRDTLHRDLEAFLDELHADGLVDYVEPAPDRPPTGTA